MLFVLSGEAAKKMKERNTSDDINKNEIETETTQLSEREKSFPKSRLHALSMKSRISLGSQFRRMWLSVSQVLVIESRS